LAQAIEGTQAHKCFQHITASRAVVEHGRGNG